jgi:hypothetical protein
MMQRLCFYALLSLALCGCALTATGGPVVAGPHAEPVPAVSFGASAFAFRKSSGTFGARVLTVADHGLKIRSGAVHAGWDWRAIPGRLVIEPGVDLGAGSPANIAFKSAGAYAGFAPSVRLRLWGVDDSEPAFNLLAPAVELVVLGRAGAWMPPEASHSATVFGEFGVEFGLRFSVGCDLFATSQGKIGSAESIGTDQKGDAP